MGILDDAANEADRLRDLANERRLDRIRQHGEARFEIAKLAPEFAQVAEARGFPKQIAAKLPVKEGWLIWLSYEDSDRSGSYGKVLVAPGGKWWWVELRDKESFFGESRRVAVPAAEPTEQLPGREYIQRTFVRTVKELSR